MRTGERSVRLPASDLPEPGRVRVVDVGGHRVGVVRLHGSVHALADRCPHRGAPICSHGEVVADIRAAGDELEVGEPDRLRCPWHKWDFDLATGVCAAAPRLRVKTYHAWLDGADIVVSLDPPGAGQPPM